MKAIAIVLTLALCFVGVATGYAADAFMGTWKLNEAKSKLAAGAPKNNTVVYEAAGDNSPAPHRGFMHWPLCVEYTHSRGPAQIRAASIL